MLLPYPEYSWNFTQHAIGLKPINLFELLSAASLFENQTRVGDKINEILSSKKILTSNIREGKPSAWRDYQQILSETGLIYSTKIERPLRLTEAGRLLLQGEIGFSELMSIQALRYQYPNGLKSEFLDRQIQSAVLIKPGTLILRLLIELFKSGKPYKISLDQCQNFVFPIKQNKNWPLAFEKLKNNHAFDLSVNKYARRNIQDWFKFLETTDLFELERINSQVYITLTSKVISNIQTFDSLCSFSEDPASFWIPTDDTNKTPTSWFTYFGHIPTKYYVILEKNIDENFIKENYIPNSLDDIDEYIEPVKSIELSPIGLDGIKINDSFDIEKSKDLISSGYIKRREKAKLHDEIINIIAKHYINQGCTVFEDKNSIDLLVKSPKEEISIFEVKTATPRNIYQRTRLAVGQVLEYGYRYNQDFGSKPKVNIALNLDMESQDWLIEYMNKHLDIGIVSVLGEKIRSYPERLLKI